MSIDFDTTVTGEEVQRDEDGNIKRLKTRHYDGGQRYWVVIAVEDGTARFEAFAPIESGGGTIIATKKIGLFDSSKVRLVDFEKTAALLASAGKYAREVHDLDIRKAIYLDEWRAGGDR